MPDIRNQEPDRTSPDYQAGKREALETAMRDLATTLRIHALDNGNPDEDVLTDQKVREIFAGTFGAQATEEEFGPEPTGSFDGTKILSYLPRAAR
jgi:hypothetical protein